MINVTDISIIPVHCFSSIREAVLYISNHGAGKIAVAINPEKILSSMESKTVKDTLLSADIRYLDGIGAVKVAEKKLSTKLTRIPGCELWESLMRDAGVNGKTVFLLGATESVLSRTHDKLENELNVNVVGTNDGYFENDDVVVSKILQCQPDILTVAMGSPRQEKFMLKCKAAGVNAFMMGVGGTYNVFVGEVKRAPTIFCSLGLEWFYRLISEPTRFKRQFKLLTFIWLYFRGKF